MELHITCPLTLWPGMPSRCAVKGESFFGYETEILVKVPAPGEKWNVLGVQGNDCDGIIYERVVEIIPFLLFQILGRTKHILYIIIRSQITVKIVEEKEEI